jgi:hypothetical protein
MAYLRSISSISERTSHSLAFLALAPIIVFIRRIEINTHGHKHSNLGTFSKLCIQDEGRVPVRPLAPARARSSMIIYPVSAFSIVASSRGLICLMERMQRFGLFTKVASSSPCKRLTSARVRRLSWSLSQGESQTWLEDSGLKWIGM